MFHKGQVFKNKEGLIIKISDDDKKRLKVNDLEHWFNSDTVECAISFYHMEDISKEYNFDNLYLRLKDGLS